MNPPSPHSADDVRPSLTAVLILMAGWAERPAAAQADSVTLAPAPQYRAGAPWRLLFGSGYRELWTTPARYPVLDLGSFAGGLVPLEANSGRQTRSLRFRSADGREYTFRSIDKDVTPATPGRGGGTLRARLRQDQTHAQLPGAVVVASGLMSAAAVPHWPPRFMVLPDDPRLGPYRSAFGGMLGSIEPHAADGDFGARHLVDTDELLALLDASPTHRVDARAYLRARLMDVFMGDWDRHAGQWRWAGYPEAGGYRWVAVPKDRDYAFVSYDGAFAGVARLWRAGGVVRFGAEYPHLRPLLSAAAELDARFLAGLQRDAWDSIAADLRGRLTDVAIADAVRRLPPEHRALVGAGLAGDLRARRDSLPAAARAFHLRMAGHVEIRGSARAERVEVERGSAGVMRVTVSHAGRPLLRRTFLPTETRRVSLVLGGGADTVLVRGERGCIWLMMDGGDRVIDRSGGPSFVRR